MCLTSPPCLPERNACTPFYIPRALGHLAGKRRFWPRLPSLGNNIRDFVCWKCILMGTLIWAHMGILCIAIGLNMKFLSLTILWISSCAEIGLGQGAVQHLYRQWTSWASDADGIASATRLPGSGTWMWCASHSGSVVYNPCIPRISSHIYPLVN